MSEDRQTLLEHYQRTREETLAALDGLTDEQLSERSLDGWSVKDHLAHIALWDEIRASEVLRISAGHESAWRMTDAQDLVLNDLATELRLGWSPTQAKWELAASRQRLLEAIAGASTRGLDATLYGEAALVSTHEVQHAGWIRRWRTERGI